MNRFQIKERVRDYLQRAMHLPRRYMTNEGAWNVYAIDAITTLCNEIVVASAVEGFDPEAAAATGTSSKITPAPSHAPASMPAYLAGSYRALAEVLADEITERKRLEKRVPELIDANSQEVERRRSAELTSDCWRDVVVGVAKHLGLGWTPDADFTAAEDECGGLVDNLKVTVDKLFADVEKFKGEALANSLAAEREKVLTAAVSESAYYAGYPGMRQGDVIPPLAYFKWLVLEINRLRDDGLTVRNDRAKISADLDRMFEGLKPVRAIMERQGIAACDAGNIEKLAPFIAGLVATAENAKQLDLRNQNQASTIGNLQGRVIDLSNALSPFAVAAVHWDEYDRAAPDTQYVHTNPVGSITIGDLRTARRVFTGTTRKTPAAVAKSECGECGIVVEPGTACVLARCPGKRAGT